MFRAQRPRLLPVRPLAAGVDHRAGLHRRQPGALEILGLAANGAKYGAATVHFPLRAEDLEKPEEEES